jgi:hypothetical protein
MGETTRGVFAGNTSLGNPTTPMSKSGNFHFLVFGPWEVNTLTLQLARAKKDQSTKPCWSSKRRNRSKREELGQ